MDIISIVNGISVGVFGMILSAVFCDIYWNRTKYILMAGSMTILLLLQGIICFLVDAETVRHLYPLITHFPLFLVICNFSKKRLWALVSVLTAYLCCQLRRWMALLVVAVSGGGAELQSIVELAITVPLLLALVKFVAPSVRSISHSTSWVQSQFSIIPAVYYIFDYLTQIYTDMHLKGSPAVTEFMSFICCLAYLMFVLRTSEENWIRSQLEQTQDSLNLQISQAVREIQTLRESQQKIRAYRHDLRHHMQYLLSCIENEKLEQAKGYIQTVCNEIEGDKVKFFCENEAANLILSSFYGRAGKKGISMEIKVQIPKKISLSESDLCVFLSNALENALNACQNLKEQGKEGRIEVLAFEKNGKMFFQIANSCGNDIVFVQGIPVTNHPNHGIGVRSICALVERYSGIYTFSVDEGKFILRVSV